MKTSSTFRFRRIRARTAFFGLLLIIALIGFPRYLFPDRWLQREFEMGWSALKERRIAEVSKHMNPLRHHPRFSQQLAVLRAGILIRTGNPKDGLDVLRKVSDGNLLAPQLLLTCEALYQLKRWPEAALVAERMLPLTDYVSQAHRWLAACYYDLGSMNQAETHLLKLVELEPQDYSGYYLLGQIHLDFERFQDAIDDFRQALSRNPPVEIIPELQLGLAKARAKINDFQAAQSTLESKELEDNVEAQALLAECLWSLGQKDAAQKKLSSLLELDAADLNVLWLAARFAMEEGNVEDAIRLLSRVVSASPFHDQALMELASSHRKLGNLVEADEYLARRNSARSLFERMTQLNTQAIQEPTNADVRAELSAICEKLGRTELATVWRDAAEALRVSRPLDH